MSGPEAKGGPLEGEPGTTASEASAKGESMTSHPADSAPASSEAMRAVRRVRASEMLGPRGLLQIEHEGEIYTLRLTRNNRLILTK